MDSWTLQGDSYSFLRSAPRNFSLCHRDGTPNHVEIFDIINVPTQRSAISETTCLCDIFGDDCESPSLSSSPAAGAFVPLPRGADGTPLADDLNSSSGSYHTAPGSIEGEEGFEDSKERLQSPPPHSPSPHRGQPEGEGDVCEDASPNLEEKSKPPTSQLSADGPTSEEREASPLFSSSLEKRHSPSPPNPRQAEAERITPSSEEKHKSPSRGLLTPSPYSEPEICGRSSCESVNTRPSPDLRVAQNSPGPRSSYFHQHGSPSPGHTPENFSPDFPESTVESRVVLSSPSPLGKELSGETSVSPELKERPSSPDTEASSPFLELRGRVSLPDLFSRGSTPDVEEPPYSPELISNPSTPERDTATPPENPNPSSPNGGHSAVSTPAPRHTPPSPLISISASPELIVERLSPGLTNAALSPGLLSAASLKHTGSRTPSPDPSPIIRHVSTPSENRRQASSSGVSSSLSPSPEVRSDSSPFHHRSTAPSPEIRITASSPEPLSDSASRRSLDSSPRITGISYSVVQPEDRGTPPFAELSRLSGPDRDRTLASPELRGPNQSGDSKHSSIAESTREAPRGSPHISGWASSDLRPEITVSHPPRYRTPSPRPQLQTPSPEPRHHTPSPQHPSFSRGRSPVSQQARPQHTQPTPPLRTTPEVERFSSSVDITDTQLPTDLAKDNASPSFQLDKGGDFSKIESISPVVVVRSPVCDSLFLLAESEQKQRGTGREALPKEVNIHDSFNLACFNEEKQDFGHTRLKKENSHHNNSPVESKSLSPHFPVSAHSSPNISTVRRATSSSPVQRPEKPQPTRSISLKPAFTPEQTRRHPPTKVRRESGERFTENMAHHANRRRTPSPPLTRFTPVHIIAPEKPHRQWHSRSPSRVEASSQRIHLNKSQTNGESPRVGPVDYNSRGHCVGLGGQLEMDRQMQLEEEREVVREMERERKREERGPEKGEGRRGDRGEQVELSFNARNRKGPAASRSAAPTCRERRQGLPTVHSCSESSLATRPLQQQQALLRLANPQDTRGGGPGRRRLQPPAVPLQNKRPAGAASRPSRSSSSSMGSELDEADDEVKWFTDSAFRSLSSPEVDYLDMYNSSHRSSTNVSQPSTQESPAGVNPAWQAYADFRGSAPKLDGDELPSHQPPAYHPDGLDPSRRYEMGSFECVDVAVEREDSRRRRRGVPKRQIQLKRKSEDGEGKQDGSSENSSPGIPVMVESPSLETRTRETFLRQHSTPAATQDCFPPERSPEPGQNNERQFKLQKSASLDETCSKTKMATCLIKSVLSKKMQSVDKPEEPAEEESASTSLNVSPKPETHNPKSDDTPPYENLPVREEHNAKDEDKSPRSFGVRPSNRPGSSSSSRSVSFSQTDSEEADSQYRSTTSVRSEMKSELKVPLDSKQTRSGVRRADGIKIWDEREEGGDSANASAGNTAAPSATGAGSTQAGATNREPECVTTQVHKQARQASTEASTSKAPEVAPKKKASLNVRLTPEAEHKPGATPSPDFALGEKEERAGSRSDEKTGEDEGSGGPKAKAPMHKVRDVRQLVKNTYNLSFLAPSAATPADAKDLGTEGFNGDRRGEVREERRSEVTTGKEQVVGRKGRTQARREEREEVQKEPVPRMASPPPAPPSPQSSGKPPSRPQPMQIQYKAVCWKEDKNKTPCDKKGNKPQVSPDLVTQVSRESPKSPNANGQSHTTRDATTPASCQRDLKKTRETEDKEGQAEAATTDRKPPKLPSKDREVSTAVVLIRDGAGKTKTSASPAQEETPTPASSLSPGPAARAGSPGHGGRSVSMLLKEKGYQADIGALVGDGQSPSGLGGGGPPRKHVNSLEIPLQTPASADGGSGRERTFSSSSAASGPSSVSDNTDVLPKAAEAEGVDVKPPVAADAANPKRPSPPRNAQEQAPPLTRPREQGDFEAVKRSDPSFPPSSPAVRRFRPQPIEVRSLSKETPKQEAPPNPPANNRPQAIEVKSIANNSQKPVVPPKPSCKFKPGDFEAPRSEERSQTIVVSSPTIYRKISNDSTSTSSYTRKLAVSAVSSLKPPPSKTTATAISALSNQHHTAASEPETHSERRRQQQQAAAYTQRPATSAPTAATHPAAASAPIPMSEPMASQGTGPTAAGANQPSQPAAHHSGSQPIRPRMACPHDTAAQVTSHYARQPAAVPTPQVPGYAQPPCRRSLSGEQPPRTEDLRFYASDDPPSYDDRESFSPLVLPDLTPRKPSRYQPSSRPPPCSCTAGCRSHPGATPPHHSLTPHSLTPPAPPHSPGQALPYPVAQPALRPHQCRPDPQPMSYQPGSPKASPLCPGQLPALYQPIHQPPPCPPHPPLMQPCTADRPPQPPQHVDPRRPPVHRSPQQQPPYSDPGHGHSPGLPPMDPQYLCGPPSLGPSYGSEYGGDSSSLYSESSYGQTPRRVLLDPETGKYFYIEVPVQPLRKMLFDPETGQYVEVLIPQQAMSHSGLYPPSAAPYPSLHNPMYAPAPQYMQPYAAPPTAHAQTQHQPPRYPEGPAEAAMHPGGPGMSFRNPPGQGSKPDPQNHPPLDQSYLENMYYVPTGMNASPNTTPPNYYHKHPPNLPPSGGKRS